MYGGIKESMITYEVPVVSVHVYEELKRIVYIYITHSVLQLGFS